MWVLWGFFCAKPTSTHTYCKKAIRVSRCRFGRINISPANFTSMKKKIPPNLHLLTLIVLAGSFIKLWPEKKVQLSGHWLECLLHTFDSFWMGVIPPESSSLSKSIRKVSITATCRLEWHYQLSKQIMAFSLSNIEIQWFFFQVDT